MTDKPKLRTYKLYKDEYITEEYICKYMSRQKRSLLAQFRMGVLPLEIEVGRFNLKTVENRTMRKKVEDRLCNMCDRNEVEDEFHFLMKCNLYNELRNELFINTSLRYPELLSITELWDKFIFINKYCSFDVAKYLEKAWKLRSMYV